MKTFNGETPNDLLYHTLNCIMDNNPDTEELQAIYHEATACIESGAFGLEDESTLLVIQQITKNALHIK